MLALAIAGAVAFHGPAWLLVPTLLWLGLTSWQSWYGQPCGQLFLEPQEGKGGRWHWRPAQAAEGWPVQLRCTYLGPWLVGLVVDRQRLWLWPDSASPEALRLLRRELMRS